MTQPLPARLDDLQRRLATSRTRWQTQRLIVGLSWGLLVSAGVGLVLGLLHWLSLISISPQTILLVLVGALLVGLVGYAIYLTRTSPNLSQMAQRADQHFGLFERLSTALEIAQKSPRDAIHAQIYSALLHDAGAQASQLNPTKLVQYRLPKILLYALGIGVLAVGLNLLPPLKGKVVVPQTSELNTPEEQAATVSQLTRVAQAVGRDAERRNDPYLQATVRSIERLKADIQAGRINPVTAQQEILRLTERIERSYNLPSPSGQSAVGSPSISISPNAVSGNTPQVSVGEGGKPVPEGANPKTSGAAPAGQQSLSQSLDKLASTLEAKARFNEPKAPGEVIRSGQSQNSEECGYECLSAEAQAQAQAAADAAGRARNNVNRPPGGGAPGGFGDQAGKGEGGGAGARGEKLPEKTSSKEVRLPFQAPKSGRRIQVLAPLAPGSLILPEISGEVKAQNWVRQEEVPISLGYLETRNRGIVSGYFQTKEP